ncbi:LysR family transcriptional regulator [Streptomyces sp. NPDC002701]|uniref:LysR family transcriptional regulator n=1 Tax=Streptomyces sp. NPDC002701 TaxID=3364661 RepID=UPI003687EF20
MSTSSTPVADLDLRLVRYFLAVAEHRHFGRAAAALRVGQPSLSRQIRRLEQQVGTRLLDRTTQGTRLTEAGEVFCGQAQALLQSAAHAVASTRAIARPSHITIGYTTNLIVTPAVRQLRRRHPHTQVRTVHLHWDDPAAALLEGRVDMVVARLPFPTDRLQVTPLYDEPRVLVVSVDHRLASRKSVTLDDIADEPLPRMPDEAWNAFWRVDPRPDGSRAPDGPLVDKIEDKLELIAGNEAVSIAPAGVLASSLRPDLTAIPLTDVGPSQVVLATRSDEQSRLVDSFRELAERHLPTSGTATSTGRSSSAGTV